MNNLPDHVLIEMANQNDDKMSKIASRDESGSEYELLASHNLLIDKELDKRGQYFLDYCNTIYNPIG